MIGLALSGGGSRAIAFHLGCLRALNDLGVLDHVKVLSTISGGSVIGAYYAYSPTKSFVEFESDIRKILRRGFHQTLAREFLAPRNLLGGMRSLSAAAVHAALRIGRPNAEPAARHPSRTDLFRDVLRRDVFGNTLVTGPRRNDMDVVIGACELRTGSAFRFSNISIGGWRYGEALDCDGDVAFAVAASAAYPLLLPTLDRTCTFRKKGQEERHRVLLTDGGVYDNLGVQVLEPDRSGEFSLHAFQCDHLIICSAGQGQESGTRLPLQFFSRVSQSFEVVHRRVQDAAMRRLHHLKASGLLNGFALPYLGQQDASLFHQPPQLVARSSVVGYPTNFASMSDIWIDRLSLRGEQLTRLLVPHYLPDICS
jgi:NTE family protein